jgi:hypothetical protein
MPRISFKNNIDYLSNHYKVKNKIIEKLHEDFSQTESLKALAGKIEHMVMYIGCPHSVTPMLERIINKGVKTLTQPGWRAGEGINLGKGHFRWDERAYTLTNDEIEFLKRYMKL